MPALLAAAPASRIPRTRSASRAANAPVDENAPPQGAPSALATGRALGGGKSHPPVQRVAFAPLGAQSNRAGQMPPTPPSSQSPQRKGRTTATSTGTAKTAEPAPKAPSQKKNKLPRARAGPSTSSSTSLAAPKPASKTRRTSRSPIPDGPPHAPHILAAHRRASVSPNPTQAAAETAKNTLANSSTSAPADSQNTATSAAKTSRKKTSRARPRPSELLPAPLGPPGSEGDDTDVDELLLLPPEKTRGRGEGKTRPHPHPPAHRRSTESREPILSQSSMQSVKREGSAEVATAGAQAGTSAPIEMSFSVTAPSSDGAFAASAGTFAPVATIDEEANGGLPVAEDQADDLYVDRDMGGYDGHDIYDDWQAEPTAQPVSAIGADEIGADGAGELVVAQAESAGFEEPEPMEGARRFADLNDASSGSEFGEGDEPADEEDGALADPADGEQLSDAEPEDIVDDSAEQSAAHQTFEAENEAAQQTQQDAEDIDGNPSEAEAEALDASTFDFPASSARRSRPSYPPLSPDRTGEFDDVVPVRMGSPSPEPEMKPEPEPEPEPELELELEAFAKEVSEASLRSVSRETDTRPTPVKANEPDVFALAEAAGPAVPSSAVRSFPLHGTPSVLPALLRPSTFFPANTRSPSPAFASPHPLPSPAARPTLQFASPRLPRERYPSAAPSALSDRKFEGSSLRFAPESSPAKSWTRGPAFFRSSSFSPPAHAALPKTATLFERHPGGAAARSRARGDGGAADQSRDYRRSVGLETSSPVAGATSSPGGGGMSASGRRQSHEPEPEPDEEEDADGVDEVGQEEEAHQSALSRRRSPTFADASDEVRQEQSPRRQTASGSSEASDPGDISDGSVRSPARSVTGDVRMSTPSPRHSSSSERDQPSTPREASPSNADCRMASPSPARNENTRAQGSLLRARFGEFVEGSKSRIQGMLFGSPNKQAVPQPTAAAGVDAAARSMSAQRTEASRSEQIDSLQEGAEEPFADPKLHPTGVPAGADSTFSLHAQSGSGETFLSNASRLSRRRSRPSHPTLPVIEISSTDAHAAARAAAILKVYHKYVEQGVEAVDLEQLVAAEQAGAAFDRIVAPRDLSQRDDHDDEEEEELRTLLLDAEDEVRDLVPGLINTRAPTEVCAPASFDRDSTPAEAPRTWTSRDWRRLEQALVEVSRRRLRAASVLTTTTTGMSMTSEAIANASVTGEEVDPEDVIEAFLWKWKVDPDSLEGDWAREKLAIRIEALKARRAKDARSRRASTAASEQAAPRHGQDLSAVQDSGDDLSEDSGSGSDASDEDDRHSLVKVESSDEADEEALIPAADANSSSEDDEADNDESFFAPASGRRYRRRRSSIEALHQPTALANPALRHLYDATPAPEKPQLPPKGIVRASSFAAESPKPSDAASAASSSSARGPSTPEPQEPTEGTGRSPSSAHRILSYLGSLVRRSPAASPSSTRATPRTSHPEETSPEMQQVQLSATIVQPDFATRARPFAPGSGSSKPLPPVSERKILPLPPSHVPVASTSRETLDEPSFDRSCEADASVASTSFVPVALRRRRRSSQSGERSLVWDVVNSFEEARSSREEEEARIVDLLQNSSSFSGGTKRRAADEDLRGDSLKGKGRATDYRGFIEIDRELERGFVPTGTRALDRRVSGEKRATRR